MEGSHSGAPGHLPTRCDLARFTTWTYEHRPHARFGGRTPLEMYLGVAPAIEKPRFEPRARWPYQELIRDEAGVRLRLVVQRLENRAHPLGVSLKQAA